MRRMVSEKAQAVLKSMEMTNDTNMTIGTNLNVDGEVTSAEGTWLTPTDSITVISQAKVRLSENVYILTATIKANEDCATGVSIGDASIYSTKGALRTISGISLSYAFCITTSGELQPITQAIPVDTTLTFSFTVYSE